MNEDMLIAYAEAFEILSYMDRKIILRTPIEIIQFIKKNRKENYISRIDKNDIFNKDNINRKTLSILAWLNLEYWQKDEDIKKELIEKYKENDIKYEISLKEQYSNKELFEKYDEKQELNTSIITREKRGFIENVISKIKDFFRKLADK